MMRIPFFIELFGPPLSSIWEKSTAWLIVRMSCLSEAYRNFLPAGESMNPFAFSR